MLTAQLTEVDLVLLAHERRGNPSKVMAKLLGTTVSAIDSRFRRINSRLGVPTRKAAARLAAEYGLI